MALSITPFSINTCPPTPCIMVNEKRIIPITIEEATTCCQRNALEVLFENAHIENAGDD